jgi:SPP1 gp7 family putative phage head morphogenesis protein
MGRRVLKARGRARAQEAKTRAEQRAWDLAFGYDAPESRDGAHAYAQKLRDTIRDFVASQPSLEAASSALETLRKSLPSFGDWLAAPQLLALLAGFADIQADTGDTGTGAFSAGLLSPSTPVPIAHAISAPDMQAAFRLPPREAIEWFRQKTVVSPEIYNALDAASKARSFAVSGLTNDYAADSVRVSIERALREGITQNEWLKRLEDTLGNAGLAEVGDLGLAHLRLVYHQNVMSAYSAGRYSQMQRVKVARPYWQYLTVGDDKVRPEHAALDGVVKPADDPFWSRYYPPWDFGCRCTVVSLDASELSDMGLSGPTDDADIAQSYGNLMPGLGPQLPPARAGFGGDPAARFFLSQGIEGMAATAEGRAAYELLKGAM